MTIHKIKKCSFTDKDKKEVSFYKVLYETEKEIGVAVLKCSDSQLDLLEDTGYPCELSCQYDLQRIPGKTARLYIY